MSKAVAIGMIVGSIAVAATGGGAAYYIQRHAKPDEAAVRAAQAEAERQRYVRDEEINYATLISTIDGTGHGGSMPVMVTFHLAGSKGLGEFCAQRPLVEEAVLRALEQGGMQAAVREAVNRVLEGSPVRGASLRPMTDPAVGGKAEYDTAKKCKQAAADAKKASHT